MVISGTARVFCILGDPVAQVRAPEVDNRPFVQHGIDAVLVPRTLPAAAVPKRSRPGARSAKAAS
jgi:shikimate dehydrogenase